MSGESPEQKAAVARSKAILLHRLGMRRMPSDCGDCPYETRCASFAAGRAVLCELPDDEISLTLPEPGDWRRAAEPEEWFYWRARFLPQNVGEL